MLDIADPAAPDPVIADDSPNWNDAGGPVQFGGMDGLSPDLGPRLGQAMLAGVVGQDPATVDPGAQPFLNTMSTVQAAPAARPAGPLGAIDGDAPPAPPVQADGQGDGDDPDGDDVQDAAAGPATRTSSNGGPTFPHTLDPIVEKHVAAYNRAHGFKPGDAEYLDPDLIKAMIRQEAGSKADALKNDPMQVNNTGDWGTGEKAKIGLSKGTPPGSDFGIKAGIDWLTVKAFPHDDNGVPHFAGWDMGVRAYKGRNDAGTAYAKSVMGHLADIKARN